jgi:hypothetical protein
MSAISGQKEVAAAGTAVALGTAMIHGPLMVKALLNNSDNVYIGNDGAGDVTLGNGIELDAGEVAIFNHVGSLSSLILDADTNDDGVSWIALNV